MQTVHFGRWFARAADLQRKNQTWDGWQLNYRSMQQENEFRKEFWKLVPNNARIVYGYDAHRTNELVLLPYFYLIDEEIELSALFKASSSACFFLSLSHIPSI